MSPVKPEKRFLALAFAVSLCLVAAVALAGCLQWLRFEKQCKKELESQLSAIACAKAQDIARWRQDRIRAAALFHDNEAFSVLVERFLTEPADSEAREALGAWLRKARAAHGFDSIRLYDHRGAVRIELPEKAGGPAVLPAEVLDRARAEAALFEDFCLDGPPPPRAESGACLSILLPVRMPGTGLVRAILGLSEDPREAMEPLRSEWPVPGERGEVLLVRRQGDHVVCLSGGSAASDGPLRSEQLSLERSDVPAVQAVLSRQGLLEGTDGRGNHVLSCAQAVEGTPWLVVVQKRASDAYRPARNRLWIGSGILGVLLLGVSGALALLWQTQRARFYRKRFEEANALRLQGETYRDLFENSLDLICVHDLEGKLLAVNQAAVDATGFPRDVLLQINIRDGLVPEVRSLFDKYIEEIRTHGAAKGIMKVRDAGGRIRYWQYNNTLRKDESGKPVVQGIARDVTEVVEARKTLKESEAKYRTLFESSADGIFLMTDVFLDCNERACQLWACDREDILGHSPAEFSPPLQPDGRTSEEAARERIERALSGEPQCFYWVHRRKDGALIDTEVSLKAVPLPDRTVLQATVRDISERKKAEQERLLLERRVQEAQKHESLGIMAAGIAHHFNNLLTVVLGNLDLSLRALPPSSNVKEFLEQAEQAADRAADVSRSLLAYLGQGVRKADVVDLGRSVQEIWSFLESAVPAGVRLELDLRPGCPSVKIDAGDLRQVISNLVANAFESMEGRQGTVRITVRATQIPEEAAPPDGAVSSGGLSGEGPWACLEVTDTGPGMNPETLGRVFDPFFTTKFTGRGLGLPVTLGIVRSCGGTIFLQSEPGRGTRACVMFPAAGPCELPAEGRS